MTAPDFLVIGWMKSGTTSLIDWLGRHRDVSGPRTKEPEFFSDDGRWARSWSWYARQLGPADGRLVGEASTAYADPEFAPRAAARIAEHAPHARLIAVFRDPFDRVQSHYHHQVRRNRRRRLPFAEVAGSLQLDDPEIRNSRYRLGVEPYLDRDLRILLIETESLRTEGWSRTLDHLGLDRDVEPAGDANVGATSVDYRLHHRGAMRSLARWRGRIPEPVARAARPLLVRRTTSGPDVLSSAEVQERLAPAVASTLTAEYGWIREQAQLLC